MRPFEPLGTRCVEAAVLRSRARRRPSSTKSLRYLVATGLEAVTLTPIRGILHGGFALQVVAWVQLIRYRTALLRCFCLFHDSINVFSLLMATIRVIGRVHLRIWWRTFARMVAINNMELQL